MLLKRLFLLFLLSVFLGLFYSNSHAQTTFAHTIKAQLEDFPSSKKKFVMNYIASFHTILSIETNALNDTIRVTTLNSHRSFLYTDSIVFYNFAYTTYGNIEHIKIEDEKGKPAYFGIYDSDIHYSSLHFSYDSSNKEMGYEMYSDTLLTEKQVVIDNPKEGTLTVHTLKRNFNTLNNKQIFTLDTFRMAVIKYNEDNQIYSFEEKLFDAQFKGGKIKSYRFYKFDEQNGNILEEPFSIFGNTNLGINNYERILYQYDAKGNIISWRKCDFNYVIPQPEPPISKATFLEQKALFHSTKKDTVFAVNLYNRNSTPPDNYLYHWDYLPYETYEEYLEDDYFPYLKNWEEDITIALFIYNKKGSKMKSKIYLNYKGEIIYIKKI